MVSMIHMIIMIRKISSRMRFLEDMACLKIVSNRGSGSNSAMFPEVCRLLGVKQCMSMASPPQTNWQHERLKQTFRECRDHLSSYQFEGDVKLPCCEFAVNNAWNAVTGVYWFCLKFGAHSCSLVPSDAYYSLQEAKAF